MESLFLTLTIRITLSVNSPIWIIGGAHVTSLSALRKSSGKGKKENCSKTLFNAVSHGTTCGRVEFSG